MKTVPLLIVLFFWMTGEDTPEAETDQTSVASHQADVKSDTTSVMEFETIQLTEHGLYYVETAEDGTEVQHMHFENAFEIKRAKPVIAWRYNDGPRLASGI